MPSRARRIDSWQEPLERVAQAKRFMERFGVQQAHPDDYLATPTEDEARSWNELLNKI